MQAQSKWSARRSIEDFETGRPRDGTPVEDFRAVFSTLDPASLITADEFAALLCISRASFNFRLHVGKIPDPVIREHRCVRWRVADVRSSMEGMTPVPVNPERLTGSRARRLIDVDATNDLRRGRRRHVDQ
jgi:predicted DNA-binding transcriptional regulator AlpA